MVRVNLCVQHTFMRIGERVSCFHSLSVCTAQGMGLSTYVTWSLLMGQMAYEPYTLESHVLISGWMFACFIIAAAFTAQLATLLFNERTEKRVRHVLTCATLIGCSNIFSGVVMRVIMRLAAVLSIIIAY